MAHLGCQLVVGAIMASWQSKGGPRGAQMGSMSKFEARKAPQNGSQNGSIFRLLFKVPLKTLSWATWGPKRTLKRSQSGRFSESLDLSKV